MRPSRILSVLALTLLAPLFGAPAADPLVSEVAPGVAASHVGRWIPPIESPLRVSGPFRAPPSPYASGHRGIDIPANEGDAVRAPTGGTVTFAGKVVDRDVLSIRVDARTVLSLEPVDVQALGLREGSEVVRGETIGVVATGGHCLAECVHLGVRVNDVYVNPMRYFFTKPVLLPW